MKYNNQHQNFIIISQLRMVDYLETDRIWFELIKLINTITKPIQGKPSIKAEQFLEDIGLLKLGHLSWNNQSLQKLLDNYSNCIEQNKSHFSYLSGYFPNLKSCIKNDTTPDLTLMINNAFSHNNLYGSGILVSFRQEYFDLLGDKKVLETINEISILLKSILRIKLKREYARKDMKQESWSDSLQDTFPTTAVSISNGLIEITDKFKNWNEF